MYPISWEEKSYDQAQHHQGYIPWFVPIIVILPSSVLPIIYQIFDYPFVKKNKKKLNFLPTFTRCDFGHKIKHDPLYRLAFVINIENKSSNAENLLPKPL